MYVNTPGPLVDTSRRRRRMHSAHFKAEAVGACQQPGVSVAAVALARGLNASMLHRWVRQAERSGNPIAIQHTVPSVDIQNTERFMPIALPQATTTESMILVELRRKGRSVSLKWPASAARECALLLTELMK